MNSLDFHALLPYTNDFLNGIVYTIELSLLAIVLSFAIAVPGVILRVARNRAARALSRAYVDLMRNTPLLVLLYVAYFGLGQSGLHVSSYVAGLAALTANSVGYVIEIYRGGIEGIPPGQREAADSLSIGSRARWRYVILPQALRICYPALGNQLVALILGSSLVMAISVPDLTYQALNAAATTYRYFEAFIVAALAYFVIVQVLGAAWKLVGHLAIPRYRN